MASRKRIREFVETLRGQGIGDPVSVAAQLLKIETSEVHRALKDPKEELARALENESVKSALEALKSALAEAGAPEGSVVEVRPPRSRGGPKRELPPANGYKFTRGELEGWTVRKLKSGIWALYNAQGRKISEGATPSQVVHTAIKSSATPYTVKTRLNLCDYVTPIE